MNVIQTTDLIDNINKIANFSDDKADQIIQYLTKITNFIISGTHFVTKCSSKGQGISYTLSHTLSAADPDNTEATASIAPDDSFIPNGEDAAPRTPIKLESEEANNLDAMIGILSDRVNSIDSEVEAIKEHLTEHGLGIDSTFNCDEILKRLNERNEAAKVGESNFKAIYPWPVFECEAEDETPSLEQINDTCAEIERICKRLDSIERFNIEMCAALLRSNKKFRKAFTKNVTKIKAVKHIDTDKLVPDKEITISEE